MLPTKETTALEVWCHALDHGDKPVIHGAELDYDDVHDGVHYHADLLDAARNRVNALREKRGSAAIELAIHADVFERAGMDPRGDSNYGQHLAKFRRLGVELEAARNQRDALEAKAAQDAAFATYEVTA